MGRQQFRQELAQLIEAHEQRGLDHDEMAAILELYVEYCHSNGSQGVERGL